MSKRHDQLFDDVLSGIDTTTPRTGRAENRFLRRSTGLSDRASGSIVEKTLKWVDPETCRMWERHNRRHDLLDETACADLIEGIKAQGGQEFPAIVRALPEGEPYEYEVICGARRHWTISWLRRNNYPSFRFLIEVRTLTDEEAFRLADIENRDRKDISDYERATDYARACTLYYDGHQGRMADRLNVSNAWLSRYLDLARVPDEIVRAYGAPHELRELHARKLKPLLGDPSRKCRLLGAASALEAEQKARAARGETLIPGAEVLRTLTALDAPAQASARAYPSEAETVLTAKRTARTLQVRIDLKADRADVEKALADLVADEYDRR